MSEQSSIPDAVNAEVNNRTAEIAAAAASQVDQANKDAEAIARAAASTELGSRINSLEGNFSTWKMEQEASLTKLREEQSASLASIQAMLAQRAPPSSETTVVTPVIDPKAEVTEQGEHGKPDGQTETPLPPKSTESPPASPPARKRVLL